MEKKCKKCGARLPENYEYPYCEACRNDKVDNIKTVGSLLGSLVAIAATVFVGVKSLKKKK